MTKHNILRRTSSRFVIALFAGCSLAAAAAEAQDTRRTPWTMSRLQGSPDPPAPFRLVPAFPALRFELPSSIEEIPGADRLLITEMGGKVYSFRKDLQVAQADLVLDLLAALPPHLADDGVSLFDADFHPNFGANRLWYVCYVHPGDGGHTRVSQFEMDRSSSPKAVAGSERVVIRWPSGGHNAGCLEFGRDGFLYISTGDGSGPNPPDGLTTGQDVSDLLGAVLRIDVNRSTESSGYGVPADNPFVGTAGVRPEIWAYGLRNPWKFGIDPEAGDIFAADNGWETWEMVHRIVRGGNCGWPIREGRAALRSEVQPGPTPILPPVKDHHHSEANSVVGGPVYRGDKLPQLNGGFVYGDYITGTIWMVKPDRDGAYSSSTLVDTDQRIVSFTEGSSGELFVLDYDYTGQVYELLPSDRVDNSANFPRRLSETGLFASTAELEPAPGVIPYAVRAERWVDGAEASRWVAIPGDGAIHLSARQDDSPSYPDGTVFAKQLSLPASGGESLRLETQILHLEDGEWRPYSYLWDDARSDALLVDSIGANRPIRTTEAGRAAHADERTWHVSAVNECRLCHNAGAGYVLGFVPQQLNRAVSETGSGRQQLEQLYEIGVTANVPRLAHNAPGRLVDPHDATRKLEDRARSYLHTNCGMCHHPGGNAIVSFYLRRDLPFEKLNTNKGTGIGTFGMQDAKIVVPGDPYRSVLFYRMSKLGFARMPYVGSQVVDGRGVSLIEEWIRSLPRDPAVEVSPPVDPESREAKAIHALVTNSAVADSELEQLVGSTENGLALIAQMHRGSIRDALFSRVLQAASKTSTPDIRGLFDTFLPESSRRATLGATIDPEQILRLTGDHARGKLIFFSDGARCRNCHEIDDRARSVGPTLMEITNKYKRPGEFLQHILEPSAKMDDPFAAYTVVTTSGVIVTGLLNSQTNEQIEMKTAERKRVVIPRDKVDVMRRSRQSLMPERLLSDLTAQEAADLLAYLRAPN